MSLIHCVEWGEWEQGCALPGTCASWCRLLCMYKEFCKQVGRERSRGDKQGGEHPLKRLKARWGCFHPGTGDPLSCVLIQDWWLTAAFWAQHQHTALAGKLNAPCAVSLGTGTSSAQEAHNVSQTLHASLGIAATGRGLEVPTRSSPPFSRIQGKDY